MACSTARSSAPSSSRIPYELEALNAIVHPEVGRMREEAVEEARAQGARIVVCDIPLLFERDLAGEFDVLVLVDAPKPLRQERLMRDRGLQDAEAQAMIAAQMPAELKRARADFVVDNGGTREELQGRVDAVWASLSARASLTPAARSV